MQPLLQKEKERKSSNFEVIMAVSIERFKQEYSRAVFEGYAAIFAGAGLSRSSGYANWKELLEPFAKAINLDIDREHDLVAVAQYYINETGTRSDLNQKILNEFTKDARENENIDIITRLKIYTYWTTNYDELIENGLKKNNRKVDIKIHQEDLANNIYDRDAILYKMHGDVRNPAKAVLAKDDYEVYQYVRPLFRTVLQGDLVSKTFLFIGFSFEDPNLEYVLGQMKALLEESTRLHYCFLEEIKKQPGEDDSEYAYRKAKQDLRINDLKRYGIQAVLLDSYDDITRILKEIECACLLKNIFISGSIASYSDPWSENNVTKFTHELGQNLVAKGYRLVSGFGLGIGSSLINGALEEIMRTKYRHIDEHLCLRPFPQVQSGGVSLPELWQAYREEMIGQAGIAVFIFGDKKKDSTIIPADGMVKEFEIAKNLGKMIIPVASTGRAASIIYDVVFSDLKNFSYLSKYLCSLKDTMDISQLVNLICTIVDEQQVI